MFRRWRLQIIFPVAWKLFAATRNHETDRVK